MIGCSRTRLFIGESPIRWFPKGEPTHAGEDWIDRHFPARLCGRWAPPCKESFGGSCSRARPSYKYPLGKGPRDKRTFLYRVFSIDSHTHARSILTVRLFHAGSFRINRVLKPRISSVCCMEDWQKTAGDYYRANYQAFYPFG